MAAVPVVLSASAGGMAMAQSETTNSQSAADRATYADLTTLSESSELVARVQIRRQTLVEPERSPGLAPGFARLYIEADTQALIAGRRGVGESLAYLVDVPLDAKGKPPKLKKREMLVFANTVPGNSGQIQLNGKNAQLDYSPALEARIRPILTSLAANETPPVITGIKDALAVQGTLAGESETQIFLATQDGSPVSMTILRRPGQQPVWGVSWGEIIDSSARPPRPETLEWYRLACGLPRTLPSSANLARNAEARRIAACDYNFVLQSLGWCTREITEV